METDGVRHVERTPSSRILSGRVGGLRANHAVEHAEMNKARLHFRSAQSVP
jgi:hypothetical protein